MDMCLFGLFICQRAHDPRGVQVVDQHARGGGGGGGGEGPTRAAGAPGGHRGHHTVRGPAGGDPTAAKRRQGAPQGGGQHGGRLPGHNGRVVSTYEPRNQHDFARKKYKTPPGKKPKQPFLTRRKAKRDESFGLYYEALCAASPLSPRGIPWVERNETVLL
eukprot:163080-Prorocentrum_minimum.AAC.1